MTRHEDIPERVWEEATAHMRRVGWYDERHIAETSRAILAAEKRVRKECEKFAEMEAARLNSITAISRDEDAIRIVMCPKCGAAAAFQSTSPSPSTPAPRRGE